jgi:phage terminase large subunit
VPEFRPNSKGQEDFLLSEARVAIAVGGVGSGKSTIGCIKTVLKLSEGKSGVAVSPNFPHLTRSLFPELMKWMPMSKCTNAHLDHPYTNKKYLSFDINGKEVRLYYGGIEDAESWTGLNVNFAFMDEAGRIPNRRAFDVLLARIRIGPDPQLYIATTARGRNWLYEVAENGVFDEKVLADLRKTGWAGKMLEVFHLRTQDNAPNLDPLYYATLQSTYTGKYALQELGGQFVSLEGAVWEDFSVDNNVTEEAEYVPGAPIEWGVDDGFVKGHPRVFLFAQVIPPYINIFDEYTALYELPETSVENALKKPYPTPSVAYVDSSAAELRARLWAKNIDTIAATHDVSDGIMHTAAFIKDGRGKPHVRFHPRCEKSIRQLPSYVRDEDTQKPIKNNDDIADSLRYLLANKDLQELIDGAIPQPVRAKTPGGIVIPEKPAIINSDTALHDFYKKIWGTIPGGRKP